MSWRNKWRSRFWSWGWTGGDFYGSFDLGLWSIWFERGGPDERWRFETIVFNYD